MPRKSANSDAHSSLFDPSNFAAIRVEDVDAVAQLKSNLIAFYQPANSEELFAVERITLARHSLLRTYRMETGLVTFGLQKALQTSGTPQIMADNPETTRGQNHSFWMAAGFCDLNSKSHWQFFLRYQAQAERLYRRAIEEFQRLRSRKGVLPAQTVLEGAPEPAAARPPTAEPARLPTTEPVKSPTTEPARPLTTEPARPPNTEPAMLPTTESARPPAAETQAIGPPPFPSPRRHMTLENSVQPATEIPAAVTPHCTRHVSTHHRPARVPRRARPVSSAAKTAKASRPNAP